MKIEIREVMEKIHKIDSVIDKLDDYDGVQEDAITLLVEYREKILSTEVNI